MTWQEKNEHLQRLAETALSESDSVRQAAAAGERERAHIHNLVRTARMRAAAGAASAVTYLDQYGAQTGVNYSYS